MASLPLRLLQSPRAWVATVVAGLALVSVWVLTAYPPWHARAARPQRSLPD
jgi:hypothetical protein